VAAARNCEVQLREENVRPEQILPNPWEKKKEEEGGGGEDKI
jgi:hypothetical protein